MWPELFFSAGSIFIVSFGGLKVVGRTRDHAGIYRFNTLCAYDEMGASGLVGLVHGVQQLYGELEEVRFGDDANQLPVLHNRQAAIFVVV